MAASAIRRPSYKQYLAMLFVGVWLAFGNGAARAQQRPEYEVKAEFLPLFSHFVKWPATAFPDKQSPLIIGVLGNDPFGSALDQAIKKEGTAGGRKLVLKRSTRVDDLKTCHVLFICKSEENRIEEILAGLGESSILTIGDFHGFAERGGMINLFLKEDKIRFEINPEAARRRDLKLSSQLLNLAKIVKTEPDKEGG